MAVIKSSCSPSLSRATRSNPLTGYWGFRITASRSAASAFSFFQFAGVRQYRKSRSMVVTGAPCSARRSRSIPLRAHGEPAVRRCGRERARRPWAISLTVAQPFRAVTPAAWGVRLHGRRPACSLITQCLCLFPKLGSPAWEAVLIRKASRDVACSRRSSSGLVAFSVVPSGLLSCWCSECRRRVSASLIPNPQTRHLNLYFLLRAEANRPWARVFFAAYFGPVLAALVFSEDGFGAFGFERTPPLRAPVGWSGTVPILDVGAGCAKSDLRLSVGGCWCRIVSTRSTSPPFSCPNVRRSRSASSTSIKNWA